jgi:hypothetical protein
MVVLDDPPDKDLLGGSGEAILQDPHRGLNDVRALTTANTKHSLTRFKQSTIISFRVQDTGIFLHF